LQFFVRAGDTISVAGPEGASPDGRPARSGRFANPNAGGRIQAVVAGLHLSTFVELENRQINFGQRVARDRETETAPEFLQVKKAFGQQTLDPDVRPAQFPERLQLPLGQIFELDSGIRRIPCLFAVRASVRPITT
jgi:hypothetical protein